MNHYHLHKIGQGMVNRVLRATYTGTLKAVWMTMPELAEATYDDVTGRYLGPDGKPVVEEKHEMLIPALFDEAANIEFKYAKYGVRPATDSIAIIPEDFTLPDSTAMYYRAGDPKGYKLVGLINKADMGVGPAGLPETAYKVLHLRREGQE